MSFKLKTLLLFFAISLIPYALTMIIVGNSFKQEQAKQIETDLKSRVQTIGNLIDHHFKTLKQDMLFLANSDVMNDIYTKDLDQRISHLLAMKKDNLKLIDDFYVTDLKHQVISSSNLNAINQTKDPQHAFIATPIHSSFNQKLIGYLHLNYSYENLLKFFKTSDHRQFFIKDDTEAIYLKKVQLQDPIWVSKHLPEYHFTLILEEDKAYAYQLIKKYEQWFIIILLIGIFVISIVAFLFAQRLTTPILALAQTAADITKTQDYTKHVPYKSEDEIGQLAHSFEAMISSMNDALKQNELLNKEIEDTQREVVFTMGAIGESRSKETGNHVKRVAEYSKLLALHYGLSETDAELLKQASPMHDIGKVAIPDAILNKPGSFTPEEFRHMQKHAELGYEMLQHSERSLLKAASIVANEHHEKWDGSGYPHGKKGEEIHIFGRITALADVFDALGSDRCYKKAWEDERIFKLFKEERGKHFEPKLIDIFFDNLESFFEIRRQFKDI